MTDDVKEEDF